MEPTQVTVVEHERRSDFREWVDRNGIKAAVLAIAISAVILGAQYSDQGAESVHAAERDLLNTASEDLGGASPASLDGLLGEPEGTAVEPWGGRWPRSIRSGYPALQGCRTHRRWIALITERPVIVAILAHLGLEAAWDALGGIG